MNTLVPAYAKQCAVDKADPGAFPHTASLHKENERDYNCPFKFSKSIVCHCLWKYISHMFLNFIDIERLGMRREGCFKEFVTFVNNPDGSPKYEDTCVYAILEKEWNTIRQW